MDTSLRKLTLAIPKNIKASILDALDGLDPGLQGYSFVPAQGRGPSVELSTGPEKVLGASNIVLILIILPEAQIPSVLETVLAACSRPKILYWVEAILDFGRLQ